MYKLYQITNTVNGKRYIGITKLSVEERWKKHLEASQTPLYPLNHAIVKYGPDNFVIEVLEENSSRNYISSLEEPTIQSRQSHITQNGYNVAKGGFGGDLGPEAAAKRKATINNRSPEEKLRLAESQRVRQTGKTKENDHGRRVQAEKIKGNQFAVGLKHSEQTKQTISQANKFKRSKETRQLMSESAILNQNGKRFSSIYTCCLCCQKQWNIGNYTQHIKRMNNEFQ
jgi:group I intron endonuclease